MNGGVVIDPGNTWVIKIGSSLLTNDGQGLAIDQVGQWVDDIATVTRSGKQVVIVSSGAVAEGMTRLGLTERPRSLHVLQAAAAVGQMGLIQLYESNFQRHNMHTAQVLLTHDDLKSRERYLNARSTLRNLLSYGVVPVVNENDTVVTDEIRFGDNDTLAALVANLIEADLLVLLTDQDGLYRENPRDNPDAELVREAKAADESLVAMAGEGSVLGRGGMVTKVRAAGMASRSGANTVIANGRMPGVIQSIAAGQIPGTLLRADAEMLVARKQWLASLPTRGQLILDDGAVTVLKQHGRSLLSVGVKSVNGEFTRGEMVACVDSRGVEIARGFANYNAGETRKIAGQSSREIESILGYLGDDELIHRDNLVLSAWETGFAIAAGPKPPTSKKSG